MCTEIGGIEKVKAMADSYINENKWSSKKR